MKTKNKLLLLLLNQSKEDGFTLPLIIGMGLIILIVGLTMIMRSSDDQVDAISQKGASNSLVASEVGITRIQNFLNNNRNIAIYNFDNDKVTPDTNDTDYDWKTITTLTTTEQEDIFGVCSTGGLNTSIVELQQYTNGNWQTIDYENNVRKGQFLVEDYVYTPETGVNPDTVAAGTILGNGKLTIKGRFNSDNNNDVGAALSRIRLKIPITKTPPDAVAFPGLWIGGGTIYDNNEIQGDLMVKGCDTDIGGDVTGKRIPAPTLDFPDLPPKPGEQEFIDKGYILTGDLGTITSDITLPRDADMADPTKYNNYDGVKVYRYKVDAINLNNDTVTINTNATQKVVFYLEGNIDVSGQSKILHQQVGGGTPVKLANFQVYGYGTDPNGFDTVNTSDSHICMNGSGVTYGFLFAPDYVAGIAGSGGVAGFIGSVWIQQWNPGDIPSCGSNTSNTVLTQNIGWDDLADVESELGVVLVPRNLPPTLHPVVEWERMEFK